MVDETSSKSDTDKKNVQNWLSKLRKDMSQFELAVRDTTNNSEKYVKLLNGLKYWNKTFKSAYMDQRYIFTLYSEERDFKMDISSIVLKIIDMVGKEAVIGLFFPRNGRYLGVDFSTTEQRQMVQDNFNEFNGYAVVPAQYGELSQYVNIRVHWAPITNDFALVSKALEDYIIITAIKNEQYNLNNEISIKTGVIEIKGVLKKNICDKDIPYLLIMGTLTLLVVVKGREPICLNCKTIGHKAYECNVKKCEECGKFVEGGHINNECKGSKQTYAQAIMLGKNKKDNSGNEIGFDYGCSNNDSEIERSGIQENILKEAKNTSTLSNLSQQWALFTPDMSNERQQQGHNLVIDNVDLFSESEGSEMETDAKQDKGQSNTEGFELVAKRNKRKIRRGINNNGGTIQESGSDSNAKGAELKETRRVIMDNADVWRHFNMNYIIKENNNNSRRSGMAFVISKSIAYGISEVMNVSERIMVLKIMIHGYEICLINVHIPVIEVEKKIVWKMLEKLCSINKTSNIIIGGDMNINNQTYQRKFQLLLDKFQLVDLAEYCGIAYLPTRIDKKSSNRLDRMVLSTTNGFSYNLKYLVVPHSDHLAMILRVENVIENSETCNRIGMIPIWDTEVLTAINTDKEIMGIVQNNKCNALIKWQLIKKIIYQIGVSHNLNTRKAIQREIDELNKLINNKVNKSAQDTAQIYDLRLRLEYLLTVQKKNMLKKISYNIGVTASSPRWSLISLLKNKKKTANVHSIISEEVLYTSNMDIVKIIQEKFIKNNMVKFQDKDNSDQYKKFHGEKVYKYYPSKNKGQKGKEHHILDLPFNRSEVEEALGHANVQSSPGPDGIGYGLYKALNVHIITVQLDFYNFLLNEEISGEVYGNVFRSYLKIIPKKYMVADMVIEADKYRPIALSNCDLKVLEKIILKRITPIIEKSLSMTIYGIKGRTIGQALLMLHLIFSNYCKKKRDDLYVIRIDMEGAFNNVNIKYLTYLLIKYLGNNKTTRLLINILKNKTVAFLNHKIYLKFDKMPNGILQGSPMSSLLYSFYLVELVEKIETISKGIWIAGKIVNIKIVSYIDDITVFVSGKKQLEQIYQLLKDFMTMTGSTINFQKSYVWDLKNKKTIKFKELNGEHGKILGVKFPINYATTLQYSVLQQKLEDIEVEINRYKMYNLGLFQKVKLVNTLLSTRFFYYFPFVSITGNFFNRYTKIMQRFLFTGYKFVGAYRSRLPTKKGGLGLIDIKAANKSIMFNYVKRNIMGHEKFKRFYDIKHTINDPIFKQWMKTYEELKMVNENSEKLKYKKYKLYCIVKEIPFLAYKRNNIDLGFAKRFYLCGNLQNFVIKYTLGILPTKEWLRKKGFGYCENNISCVFGCNGEENLYHNFWECSRINDIRMNILQKIIAKYDIGGCLRSKRLEEIPKRGFKTIVVLFFAIWKARCDIVFQNINVSQAISKIMGYFRKIYIRDMFALSSNQFYAIWDSSIV